MSAGLVSGRKTIGPVTMTGTVAIGEILDLTLAEGDNVIAVPAGAVAVAIFLGTTPSVTVKLRTNLNAADAGLAVAPYAGAGFTAVPLVVGTTEVILNVSGSLPGVELSFI